MMDKIGHRIVISFVSQISAGEAREGKQIPALLFTLNCCFTLPNHCSFHKRWCHMGCKHLQMSWTKSNLVYKSQQHSVSLVFLILFCHCSLHKKIKSCHHLLYMLFLIIYLFIENDKQLHEDSLEFLICVNKKKVIKFGWMRG